MKLFKWPVIFLILTGISGHLYAETRQNLTLTAAESHHQFPFFDTQTPVWAYNDKIPGPVSRAAEGTTLEIDFINNLQEASSIHWHGLRIDNAMDGVPGVTQEPVGPGKRFRYRLKLQEAGTFWYHPHLNSSEQLERGLKGALIVEPIKKLPWSQDMVWLVDDWLLQKDGNIFPRFNTGHDLMHDGRWGNVLTINGKYTPEFWVTPGERIRIRLINAANARVLSLDFPGLPAKVIAVDGRPVSTVFEYKGLALSPGNRIDLDITVPPDAGGKTFTVADQFTKRKYPLAHLKVKKAAPVETPDFEPVTAKDFIPAKDFENVTAVKSWDLSAIRGGKFGIGWAMNQLLWPDADATDIALGKPYKVMFTNGSSRLHPMHLHGVFFRVLEVNAKPTVEPFTRDTVLVGPHERVVIGLVPMHPGIWLTHCHIQSHAEAGMMTTITVD
jgi:FtsP/CotA-like multicopper oxidase with cupredoxin domain